MNAGGQLCLDLSVLTEGPPFDCTLSVQEQLADIDAHRHINRFEMMRCDRQTEVVAKLEKKSNQTVCQFD